MNAQTAQTLDQATKNAYIGLIARVGLTIAIEIIEGINSAATDADAIKALKTAASKTPDDYLAEEAARRAKTGG